MRKLHLLALFSISIIGLFAGNLNAQSYTAGDQITLQVNDYSLIDTNHAPVNLSLSSSVAGAPVTSVSNSDMYVKVSSIVPGGTHRDLTVKIASGTVPQATKLTVVAAPCTTGGGNRGTVVTTPVVLSSADQLLVDLIGSCYTGTGINNGYRLTFTWAPINLTTDYQLLKATSSPTTITVVLTIGAHNGN